MNPALAIGSVWLASEHPGDHLPLLQVCSAVLGFPVAHALPAALSPHLSAFLCIHVPYNEGFMKVPQVFSQESQLVLLLKGRSAGLRFRLHSTTQSHGFLSINQGHFITKDFSTA